MNISASQLTSAAAARQAQVRPPQSAAVSGAPVQATDTDKLDISKGAQGAAPTSQGQTTSERVASFSEKVHQRLELLAQSLDPRADVDLTEVEAQFAQNVQRLQDGIASGAFDDKQLATGVQNTLSLLTGGVREALGIDDAPRVSEARATEAAAAGDAQAAAPTRASEQSPAERISALEDKVNDRISGLLAGLDADGARGAEAARAEFAGNVARVQAGLADGSLSVEQVAQGMQNSLGMLSAALSDAAPDGADARGVDEGPTRASQQARFSEFSEKLAERLASLDVEGADARLVNDAATTFESHMERLEHAFFEQGSIDREQFGELFSSMLGQLQKDLAAVLQPEQESVKLYGADLGVDALAAGASSFDVQV